MSKDIKRIVGAVLVALFFIPVVVVLWQYVKVRTIQKIIEKGSLITRRFNDKKPLVLPKIYQMSDIVSLTKTGKELCYRYNIRYNMCEELKEHLKHLEECGYLSEQMNRTIMRRIGSIEFENSRIKSQLDSITSYLEERQVKSIGNRYGREMDDKLRSLERYNEELLRQIHIPADRTAIYAVSSKDRMGNSPPLVEHNSAQTRESTGEHATPMEENRGDASVVKTNAESNDFNQMLYAAACNNVPTSCENAIKCGADVNASHYIIKWTPIHIASKHGHLQCVNILLAHGADVNVQDVDGVTPLMMAVQENHPDVCDRLIQNGVDVNIARRNGKTALHDAAALSSDKIYDMLIAAGADDMLKAADGKTPKDIHKKQSPQSSSMHSSQDTKYSDNGSAGGALTTDRDKIELDAMIKQLRTSRTRNNTVQVYQKRLTVLLPMIRNGADVNISPAEMKGNTALHYACGMGNLQLVQWLVEHGADVNKRTNKGASPLNCVGGANGAQIRAFLIQHGAVK